MSDSNWSYTAAEKKAIGTAFAFITGMVDGLGRGNPRRLQEALRYERRERSCMATAKALIVEGFANGLENDPRASEIACISEGIATATIMGAGCRRYGAVSVGHLRVYSEPAKAAHEARMARGIAAARAGLTKTA